MPVVEVKSRNKNLKTKQEVKFQYRIAGILYNDPPESFKQHIGRVISNVLCR